MKLVSTPINGVTIVETERSGDERGTFARLFCERELQMVLGERRIVQINHSVTNRTGAIRGLHFQNAPHAEMKMVRCLKGKVWDVAVDLRKESPTYLCWHAVELSAENAKMMIIPEGCAHGFQTLEAHSELLYLHTAFYTPASEGGIRYADPALAIDWPLPVTDISRRDREHPLIDENFCGARL